MTPSYARDLELCKDLVASVLRHTQADVIHRIIVPTSDLSAFERLAGERTLISDVRSHLPRSMVKIPRVNGWLNLRYPFPPIRGWMAQQIVKLAAAASAETDVVLLIDSDVLLIRAIDGSSFSVSGKVQFFEIPGGIDESLPRHHLWHAAARRLLGLPPQHARVLPDYICWPCAWQPESVRRMLKRVELVTGLPWATAVGRELHFSEMILYGVFIKEVLGASEDLHLTNVMRCLNHSAEVALDEVSLRALLAGARPDDVAIMISAKSGTPLAVRRGPLANFLPG
ncbi:DUF6492 family protein [Arthrobacter sp. BE255]|uniref:DUF6492 family protein n=1 Tax=Arthrobacter sp. BE255 TaxID=2817721 RepID=UPI00286AC63F|nr:DUF6492 family protein [Arthrobacter sp. BE255]